jgi:hypothetical protein
MSLQCLQEEQIPMQMVLSSFNRDNLLSIHCSPPSISKHAHSHRHVVPNARVHNYGVDSVLAHLPAATCTCTTIGRWREFAGHHGYANNVGSADGMECDDNG